ncbi:solute symporter family transporter [Sanghuangporus baumii]|uniref:Solute symporter family transporter n=1 Tax=Sanghuangporus baumii TaxID=108892 RepID=A0A9Q5HQ01_SANBA|nr:solute symporter family transporter [Sanghuangporus baumii]
MAHLSLLSPHSFPQDNRTPSLRGLVFTVEDMFISKKKENINWRSTGALRRTTNNSAPASFSSMANGQFDPYLPQASGYAIILGGGSAFAILMLILSWLQSKFTQMSPFENEEFSSASRNVKPGLVCSGIVSAWTWSATLMVSSLIAFQFGVAGGWWYGVCGTASIILFSVIASKVKENANGARTFLEIVRARAAIMLLPVGVVAFVIVGGLRSTFISDYTHTTIVFVIIWLFLYTACGSSKLIGSPSALHALLVEAAKIDPAEGNHEGSYLTFRSKPAFIFGATTVSLGFAQVVLDQSYWQRAIASKPSGTTLAYTLGGLSWFSIPLTFGTTMGLSARALQNNPVFPTYPLPLSLGQQDAGLVAPAAAVALLGRSGAIAMLIITYMAVTSACSAQLISVSSIFTYDVYRTYWRPKAKPKELLRVAHLCVALWGTWISLWCIILNAGKVDMNFMFYFSGAIAGSPVVPIVLTVLWSKLSKAALLIGCMAGTALGIMTWFTTCRYFYGEINIQTLVAKYSALAGSLASLGSGAIISVGLSLIKPDNYNFRGTRSIKMIQNIHHEHDILPTNQVINVSIDEEKKKEEEEMNENPPSPSSPASVQPDRPGSAPELELPNPADVKRAFWISTTLIAIIAVLIPIPLGISTYVFSPAFFTAWMIMAMVRILRLSSFVPF